MPHILPPHARQSSAGRRNDFEQSCYMTPYTHVFFKSFPLNCGFAAAETILLQPVLSWTSYFVVPIVVSRLPQSNGTASIFLAFFSQVVPSPESFLRRIIGLVSSRPNHLSLAFLYLCVIFSTFSLSLVLSFLTSSLSVWHHTHGIVNCVNFQCASGILARIYGFYRHRFF